MSPTSSQDYARFADLRFDDFRRLATDESLSEYEKIGFPDTYRQGFAEAIFSDIASKVPALSRPQSLLMDIGPGCSDLPRLIIDRALRAGSSVVLIDSEEMLRHLVDREGVEKVVGRFPDCPELRARLRGQVDGIICYSVLHYVFADGDPFSFVDAALELLAPGGTLLLGDIPNVSMRKRWFASASGQASHAKHFGHLPLPVVNFNELEPGKIDDAVIAALLLRARSAGFNAYVVPQAAGLPMASRREDVRIDRP